MYRVLEGKELRPTGWMRRQLEIQAKGLSGNLDKVWPSVRDSAWIGGDHDSWERVPYWLDGFIPLAYLLEDEDMIARAEKYVRAIIERQQEDGWLCPCPPEERATYDIWALFLIGKVLTLYWEFTHDRLALECTYRAMKNLKELMDQQVVVLHDWGKSRWFEAFLPLLSLYEQYGEEWIVDLAKKLREQGLDYPSFLETWKRPLNKWVHHTHIVNIAMMFKYEALTAKLFGEKYQNSAEKLWRILEKYNGTAVGIFTGDECLSGVSNIQGTELCSVVELMYCCEVLYAITGDDIWAQRLEKAAFNALPATLSDDMWVHQYDQMVNQIACYRFPGKSIFRTNGQDANCFGLAPNYGCCTANFNQAWPKLARFALLRSEDGLCAPVWLPVEVHTQIQGVPVTVTCETEYPFRFSAKWTVTVERPVQFALKLRVPAWAKSLKRNGVAVELTGQVVLDQLWKETQSITLEVTDQPRLVDRPHALKVAEYGPLVFAVPIAAKERLLEDPMIEPEVERQSIFADRELYPCSAWNFGFTDQAFTVEENAGDEIPFSSQAPRLTLRTKLCKVNWDMADGYEWVANPTPRSRRPVSAPEEVELFPYGCTKLHMTELPKASKK